MKVYVVSVLVSIDEFHIVKVFDSEEKACNFIKGKDSRRGNYPSKSYFFDEMEVE